MTTRANDNGFRRPLYSVAAGLALLIVAQTGALVYWAGTMTARMKYADKEIDSVRNRVHHLEMRAVGGVQ